MHKELGRSQRGMTTRTYWEVSAGRHPSFKEKQFQVHIFSTKGDQRVLSLSN